MFITNTTVFGGRGFSVGGGGVLKTATGAPPITLEKTLERLPESITVYGNSGGVGDRTANLFGNSIMLPNRIIKTSGKIGNVGDTAIYIIHCKPSTQYTIKRTTSTSGSFRAGVTATLITSGTLDNFSNSPNKRSFVITSAADSQYLYISVGGLADATDYDIQVYEGSYTAATMPQYEPYGYRIPILINPPILPSGYTKLEYIEAMGTQYIDTGVVPTVNTQVDYKVRFAEGAADSSPLISARTGSSSSNRFIPIGYASPSVNYRTTLGTVNLTGNEINFSIDYTGSFQPQNNVSIINGVSFELTGHGYTKTNNNNLYLFATSGYGSNLYLSKGRMYYCQIYGNGTLIRNFIPAKRNSDGEIGMYDTVNNVFYTNADSGDNFGAGAEIPHKTINLYSDAALGADESLIVNPKTHEATKHDDTSVAGLQDWEQDWKIPKADELTVSAGTTVEPRNMEIKYYGKR